MSELNNFLGISKQMRVMKVLSNDEYAHIEKVYNSTYSMLPLEELLTPEEVAKILGCSITQLGSWRYQGGVKIAFIKMGNLVRYHPRDVQAFLAKSRKFKAKDY